MGTLIYLKKSIVVYIHLFISHLFRLYSYFVHQDLLFTLVDGNWSSWGVYGDCSVKCGGGIRRRSRSCTNPKPSNGGRSCRGSSTQTVTCNMDIPCDGKQIQVLFVVRYLSQWRCEKNTSAIALCQHSGLFPSLSSSFPIDFCSTHRRGALAVELGEPKRFLAGDPYRVTSLYNITRFPSAYGLYSRVKNIQRASERSKLIVNHF